MRDIAKTERGRGLGPFTGRQLTTIVCVAIVATMFAIPTAALAAGAAFRNKSNGKPAVEAVNTGSRGVGVSGKGKRYGVFSNGPLGVATGKTLRCSGCVKAGALATGSVGVRALSTAAKQIQPLASGHSESGIFAMAAGNSTSGLMADGITFAQPVPGPLTYIEVGGTGPVTHCAGPGSADRGYVCLYEVGVSNGALYEAQPAVASPYAGVLLFYTVSGANAFANGEYTVTAP